MWLIFKVTSWRTVDEFDETSFHFDDFQSKENHFCRTFLSSARSTLNFCVIARICIFFLRANVYLNVRGHPIVVCFVSGVLRCRLRNVLVIKFRRDAICIRFYCLLSLKFDHMLPLHSKSCMGVFFRSWTEPSLRNRQQNWKSWRNLTKECSKCCS